MKREQATLDVFKQNVTIDRLRLDAEKIKNSDISYPEFLKYFSDLKKLNRHNIIIGINFTYGWMPTIFDFRSDNLDEAVNILNRAKHGQIPNEVELETLKKCFNNSLVGTSKLLHFINPSKFAIWDSRVIRYLGFSTYWLYKPKSYLDFLEFCKDITNQPEYNEIHNSIVKKFNHNGMTKYRTIELVMYEKDRKNNS